MAQLGSALDWGARGRRFKSCQPDRCLALSEAHWSRDIGVCISIASLGSWLLGPSGVRKCAASNSVSPRRGLPRVAGLGSDAGWPDQPGGQVDDAGLPSWGLCSERRWNRAFSGIGNPDTPSRLESQLCWCACMARMAADNAHRSSERSVGVMCRMSAAEREELKHLDHAAGCSVQTYIMRAVFGRTEVQDLPRGRRIGVGDNRAPSLGQHPDDKRSTAGRVDPAHADGPCGQRSAESTHPTAVPLATDLCKRHIRSCGRGRT